MNSWVWRITGTGLIDPLFPGKSIMLSVTAALMAYGVELGR